jgi:hypothetical protein
MVGKMKRERERDGKSEMRKERNCFLQENLGFHGQNFALFNYSKWGGREQCACLCVSSHIKGHGGYIKMRVGVRSENENTVSDIHGKSPLRMTDDPSKSIAFGISFFGSSSKVAES